MENFQELVKGYKNFMALVEEKCTQFCEFRNINNPLSDEFNSIYIGEKNIMIENNNCEVSIPISFFVNNIEDFIEIEELMSNQLKKLNDEKIEINKKIFDLKNEITKMKNDILTIDKLSNEYKLIVNFNKEIVEKDIRKKENELKKQEKRFNKIVIEIDEVYRKNSY